MTMELSPEAERNVKLAVGVVATAASRYYFNKRQLWPWRISTLVAWPALGLGIMDIVIAMPASKEASMRKVDAASEEEALKQRLARQALLDHVQQITTRSQAEPAGSRKG